MNGTIMNSKKKKHKKTAYLANGSPRYNPLACKTIFNQVTTQKKKKKYIYIYIEIVSSNKY